jgi:hypothetical protein
MRKMPLSKRKASVLHDVDVAEISAVDKAASPGAKIMLMKRDRNLKAKCDEATARLAASVKSIVADNSVDKNDMLARTFAQYLNHLDGLMKRRTPLKDIVALKQIFAEARAKNLDVSVAEAGDDEGMPKNRRRRAGDDDDDDEKDKTDMTEKSHSLDNIVKRHGFVALAKSINAGAIELTEEEYTKALVADCARRGVSFEKAFCDNSSEGLEIRKGRERCRDTAFAKAGAGALMPLMPTQTNSLAAARDVDADEEGDAYQQLVAMAERMRLPALA